MRKENFSQKIVLGFIIFSLFIPQLIFAQTEIPENLENYLQIPVDDVKQILKSLSSPFRNTVWYGPGFLVSREGVALLTFQEFSKIDTLNYLFKELPLEIGFNIIKYGFELAQLIGAGDFRSTMVELLDKFEKESVQRAVDYGLQELFKKEIRVASGAFDVKYNNNNNQASEARMQYVIIQKPLGENKYNVAIKIFSSQPIEPLKSGLSAGGMSGVLYDSSILIDTPEGKKFPPFIIEVSGRIEKNKDGEFYWIDEQGKRYLDSSGIMPILAEPSSITVSFPDQVPDLGIYPRSFWDKNIIDPLKEKYKEFAKILEKFFGITLINPQAQLSQEAATSEKEENENEEEILEEEPKASEGAATSQGAEPITPQPAQQPAPSETIEQQPEQPVFSDFSQLSEEERHQALINIILELQKRAQEKAEQEKAQQEAEARRQVLIKIIEELQKRQEEQALEQQNKNQPEEPEENQQEQEQSKEEKNQEKTCQQNSININTASKEELQKITGVGAVIAQRIIDARPFNSLNDLKEKVSGIGDKTLEKIISQGCAYVYGSSPGGGSSGGSSGSSGGGSSGGSSQNNGNNQNASSTTYCSQQNLGAVNPTLTPIIINEVAWMGNEISTSYEWIELKNISNNAVSLANWQLLDKEPESGSSTSRIQIVFNSQDLIPAGGFYLLERIVSGQIGDSSVPNISADKTYTGILSNTNESLRLFDQNCNLIDEVLANPNWPAGDNDNQNKKSMERNSNPASGWHTYSNSSPDPISNLWATPKAENSSDGGIGNPEPDEPESGEEPGEPGEPDEPDEPDESDEPAPLAAIQDLAIDQSQSQYNKIVLAWSPLSGPDILPENFSYDIYYFRNPKNEPLPVDQSTPGQPTPGQSTPGISTFQNVQEYVQPTIYQGSDGKFLAVIPDLFYNSTYYFAVKTTDYDQNTASFSNIVFKEIPVDNSPWPMLYHDAQNTSKSNLFGPTNLTFQNVTAAAIGKNGRDDDDFFVNPPVIDENNTIYFYAAIDNQGGLYSFYQGEQKWFFPDFSRSKAPAIGKDGTIYFFYPSFVRAISPSGKIKWEENFETIYTKNVLIGADDNLYFIAGQTVQSSPSLIILKDNQTAAEKILDYNLYQELEAGEEIFNISEISLDGQNNIYFSLNKKLLKISNQGIKLAQKIFETDFREDYQGSQNIAPKPGTPFLVQNSEALNLILISVEDNYCKKFSNQYGEPIDRCKNIFYAINSQDFSNEIWKKENYLQPLALNTDPLKQEFYFYSTGSGASNWAYLDIFAVDILTGDINWIMHWGGSGGVPTFPSMPIIDSQNNIYFVQGSQIFGYSIAQIKTLANQSDSRLINMSEISSDLINSFLIFQSIGPAGYLGIPSSLGIGILYVPGGIKMAAINF